MLRSTYYRIIFPHFAQSLSVAIGPCSSYNDRDILLTPNRTLQQPGKSVYFRATGNGGGGGGVQRQQRSSSSNLEAKSRKTVKTTTSSTTTLAKDAAGASTTIAVVPWEEPLKHAIYLVLNNKVDDVANVDAAAARFVRAQDFIFNEFCTRERTRALCRISRCEYVISTCGPSCASG